MIDEEELLLLLAAERAAAWDCAVRSVAHELGTPLNVVLGHAELLEGSGAGASAQTIVAKVHAMDHMLTRSVEFGRTADAPHIALVVSAQPSADKVRGMLSGRIRERNVTLELSTGELRIPYPEGFLLLLAMARFGVERADSGGRVDLHAEASESQLSLRLSSSSAPISARSIRELAQPWFNARDSTPEALALAVALTTCRRLGGASELERDDCGFRLTLTIPLRE